VNATRSEKISAKIRAAYASGRYEHSRRYSPEVSKAAAQKASETKLSKRITKVCKHCGKEWREKPSHAWRVYCSRDCMAAGTSTSGNFPCPDCGIPIHRQPHLAKHRCMECARKRLGEQMVARGHNPYAFETAESMAKRMAALQSDEARKRTSETFKDKHPQSPLLKKFSPQHVKAVECFFRSPKNLVYYCRNISRFVHENKHLFNPEDTIQKVHGGKPSKSYVCNAVQGLSRIYRGVNGSWKGWTVVGDREGRERFDLLGRNFEQNP
jgi:hypothetical protein